MPEQEVEEQIEQQPESQVAAPANTAAELGGSLDEENKFRPDFDSVIDAAFSKIKPKDTQQPAEDLIGELDTQTGPKGATGPAQAATTAQTGATGPTAAQSGATGPSGSTGPSGATGASGAVDERDKDLNELASQLPDLDKRPKTKSIIEGFKDKVTQERNQREAAQREAAELKKQIEDLNKRAIPKEVEDELKELRETLRELDASRDPSLKQKFDTKISANEDTMISLLKEHGFGKTADGKDVPGAIENLKKEGLSRRSLHQAITALEKSGDGAAVEAAEQLKDLLRENGQLSKDREREVQTFKASAEERNKMQQAELAKQVEQANVRLKEKIAEHVGKFDFLKEPPAALPTDSAAVRAEREKARVAHNERINTFNEAIKKETSSPTDTQIAARVGILYRDLVVPQLQTQLDAINKELAAAREQMKAMKGAGDLAKKISTSSANRVQPKEDPTPGETYDDAVDAGARRLGLIK